MSEDKMYLGDRFDLGKAYGAGGKDHFVRSSDPLNLSPVTSTRLVSAEVWYLFSDFLEHS